MFLILLKVERSYQKLKNSLHFREELTRPENQKFLTLRLKYKGKRKMIFMLSFIKKQKFSKLKYFFIIMKKYFFSFCDIFFYTQSVYFFHFMRNVCDILDHIVAFSLFFFRKILISFTGLPL